jgi:hypothetical protein
MKIRKLVLIFFGFAILASAQVHASCDEDLANINRLEIKSLLQQKEIFSVQAANIKAEYDAKNRLRIANATFSSSVSEEETSLWQQFVALGDSIQALNSKIERLDPNKKYRRLYIQELLRERAELVIASSNQRFQSQIITEKAKSRVFFATDSPSAALTFNYKVYSLDSAIEGINRELKALGIDPNPNLKYLR